MNSSSGVTNVSLVLSANGSEVNSLINIFGDIVTLNVLEACK